ncbi:hypothetical protein CDEF62S_03379 [Castellaniella defragrans]
MNKSNIVNSHSKENQRIHFKAQYIEEGQKSTDNLRFELEISNNLLVPEMAIHIASLMNASASKNKKSQIWEMSEDTKKMRLQIREDKLDIQRILLNDCFKQILKNSKPGLELLAEANIYYSVECDDFVVRFTKYSNLENKLYATKRLVGLAVKNYENKLLKQEKWKNEALSIFS